VLPRQAITIEESHHIRVDENRRRGDEKAQRITNKGVTILKIQEPARIA
jgi:hypothetical protein